MPSTSVPPYMLQPAVHRAPQRRIAPVSVPDGFVLLFELHALAVGWLIYSRGDAATARFLSCSDSEYRYAPRGSEGGKPFRRHPRRWVRTAALLRRITLQSESSALGAPPLARTGLSPANPVIGLRTSITAALASNPLKETT